MYITKKHVSRRTVLRGMGVTVALPFLEAMVPAGTAHAKAATGKVRLAAIEMVHGSAGATAIGAKKFLWSPEATGSAFDLSPSSLAVLEPYRDYLTIISNTDVRNAEAFTPPEIGGDHFRSSAVFLTQAHPKQTQGSDVHVATSLDQMYAQKYGQDTPIPSMQLCIENVDQAGGCAYGYACVYTDTVSWAGPDAPLPMVRDPRAAFDMLFGVGATPEQRAARRKADKSILDWITAEVAQLKSNLGPVDRARLSDYLDDVREIERRIQRIEASNASGEPRELPMAPMGVPDAFDEHVKLMFDLQAVAFASDITRVFSFKMGRDGSSRVYPDSGVKTGFHPASHHQDREDRILDFAKINKYHLSLLPYFLDKLKNTPDGDKNLLENTMVIYGSPMGNSNVHNHKRCPLIVGGPCRRPVEGQPPHQGGRRHADGQPDALDDPHAGARGRQDLWRQHRGDEPQSRARDHGRGAGVGDVMRRGRLFAGGVLGTATALCLSVLLSAQAPTVIEAARRGDTEAVRALLKQGADVNAAEGDGTTALHWAARAGHAELVQMLVYAGANVKATTRLGAYTPLMMAAQAGQSAAVAALIAGGSDMKAASATGTTPLMFAAQSGDTKTATMLIEGGADVNARETAMGQTPLMFASAFNRVDVVKLLLARGADVKATSKVVDLTKLTSPEEEFFRQQAAGGAAPAGNTPTAPGGRNAGGRGGPPPAPANGAPRPPDVAGLTRQYRYNELVGTSGGFSPLQFAVRQGHTDVVKALVEGGADVNQVNAGDKSTPLTVAVINGHFDIGQFLLDKGADPNIATENGVTPLYATLNVQWAPKALYPQPRAYLQQKLTYLDFMKVLLEKGADPNERLRRKVWYSGYNFDLAGVDEIGATAFWRAAYGADVEAMKLLVTYGADATVPTIKPAGRPRTGDGDRTNVQDVSGLPVVPVGGPAVTPLQAAAGVGYAEGFAANSHRYAPAGLLAAVTYLIEETGADVNAADHEGNTALHHAASRGDVEMISTSSRRAPT